MPGLESASLAQDLDDELFGEVGPDFLVCA